MRKYCLVLLLFFLAGGATAQRLSQVRFQNGSNLTYFTIETDQGVQIRISPEGQVLEWGSEILSDRGTYYAPKLQPFAGRVEYYGGEMDSLFNGKVRSIGTTFITYYGSYEEATRRGKIKTMGPLTFDYFSPYEEKSLQGKLKQVGNLALDYYKPYDNKAYKGKLKAIGSMPITYLTEFDDQYNAGKLKSIGPVSYAWYTQFERAKGALKSNNYRQSVGGVMIVLR